MNDVTHKAKMQAAADELGDLDGIVSDQWDSGDQWGSTMMPLFTLNDVLYRVGGQTNPTYGPGLGVASVAAPEEGDETDLLIALRNGELHVEQVEAAERILSALADELRAEGLDY